MGESLHLSNFDFLGCIPSYQSHADYLCDDPTYQLNQDPDSFPAGNIFAVYSPIPISAQEAFLAVRVKSWKLHAEWGAYQYTSHSESRAQDQGHQLSTGVDDRTYSVSATSFDAKLIIQTFDYDGYDQTTSPDSERILNTNQCRNLYAPYLDSSGQYPRRRYHPGSPTVVPLGYRNFAGSSPNPAWHPDPDAPDGGAEQVVPVSVDYTTVNHKPDGTTTTDHGTVPGDPQGGGFGNASSVGNAYDDLVLGSASGAGGIYRLDDDPDTYFFASFNTILGVGSHDSYFYFPQVGSYYGATRNASGGGTGTPGQASRTYERADTIGSATVRIPSFAADGTVTLRDVPLKVYGLTGLHFDSGDSIQGGPSLKYTYTFPALPLQVTLEPDVYWEYADSQGNPVWNKQTGDRLRDPFR